MGPSNVTLLLTNLRLLELNLRNDWPDITDLTFSIKDEHQNQKKRIQCVEWALYHLFALWDPEETYIKLQPLFPPLEHLQSLNLRTALFRCLDQAKKNGYLGKDIVLRKTMLDECKGQRLEEMLAVFSNVVLRKIVQERSSPRCYDAIAQRLALENFSYTRDHTIISCLILAYKSSLRLHIQSKQLADARYRALSDLLDLKGRQITLLDEQLKEERKRPKMQHNILPSDIATLQQQVRTYWSGNEDWLRIVLHGQSRTTNTRLLGITFQEVWKNLAQGKLDTVDDQAQNDLIRDLKIRVTDQQNRLDRWTTFQKNFCTHPSFSHSSEVKKSSPPSKINLEFDAHKTMHVGSSTIDNSPPMAISASLQEYTRIVEEMHNDIANVNIPKYRTSSFVLPASVDQTGPYCQGANSIEGEPASEDMSLSTLPGNGIQSLGVSRQLLNLSTSRTPRKMSLTLDDTLLEVSSSIPEFNNNSASRSQTPKLESLQECIRNPHENSKQKRPTQAAFTDQATSATSASTIVKPSCPDSHLTDQILSNMATTTSSPNECQYNHSNAERTSPSSSSATHSHLVDESGELSHAKTVSMNPKRQASVRSPAEGTQVDCSNLTQRTRKSMAGFEAALKKAQLDRRRSIKDAKKRPCGSSYFPKVFEETKPEKQYDVFLEELLEEEVDSSNIFKSRPRIKMSPVASPDVSLMRNTEDDIKE